MSPTPGNPCSSAMGIAPVRQHQCDPTCLLDHSRDTGMDHGAAGEAAVHWRLGYNDVRVAVWEVHVNPSPVRIRYDILGQAIARLLHAALQEQKPWRW